MSITRAKLLNATGIEVSLLAQGAAIQSIRVPSPEGPIEIVLGHEDPERYIVDPNYLGATLGRYAGRIANAQFRIGNSIVQLDKNDTEDGHLLYGDPCHSLEERCGNHDGFV
jgi:aldose 1-epimerase